MRFARAVQFVFVACIAFVFFAAPASAQSISQFALHFSRRADFQMSNFKSEIRVEFSPPLATRHSPVATVLFTSTFSAQQRLPGAQAPPPATSAPLPHRFWDKKNAWLFAGVAASRALDFHSTGNMRRRGRNEILLTNEIVDNKPAFAAIEAAGALASVGLSYLFHRTNHHRLERWVSYLHISVTTFGAVRNYSLSSYRAPAP